MKKSIAVFLIASAALAGCGVHEYSPASYTSTEKVTAGRGLSMTAYDVSGSTNQTDKRILVYTAGINLKVKNTDSAIAKIRIIASRYDGYIVSMSDNKAEIRVKADKLFDAVNDVGAIGKIKYKNIYGQDVTEEYYDYEIRIENAKKARERYLELLAKAENVEAALKVEKELERLNSDIDLMEGKLNKLSQLIDYSTITVYLQKKKKLGILGYVGVGLYKGVKWLFIRGK